MECIKLVEKSSNRIVVTLQDEFKQPVTDSDVELVMVDQNRTVVNGVSWPQPLDNLGSGVYEVVLSGALEITRNENYWAEITSASPTRGDLYQEVLCKAVVLRN